MFVMCLHFAKTIILEFLRRFFSIRTLHTGLCIYYWLNGWWNDINGGGSYCCCRGGDGGDDGGDSGDSDGDFGVRSFVCSIFTVFNFRTLNFRSVLLLPLGTHKSIVGLYFPTANATFEIQQTCVSVCDSFNWIGLDFLLLLFFRLFTCDSPYHIYFAHKNPTKQ